MEKYSWVIRIGMINLDLGIPKVQTRFINMEKYQEENWQKKITENLVFF